MKKSHWTDYINEMEKSKSPQVPSHIWDNLIPHLPQPKKDRRPIIFLLSFMLLAGAVGAYYSFLYQVNQYADFEPTINTEESKVISANLSMENSNSRIREASTGSKKMSLLAAKTETKNNNNISSNISSNNSSNISIYKSKRKNISINNSNELSTVSEEQITVAHHAAEYTHESPTILQSPLIFDFEKLSKLKIALLPLSTTPQYLLTNLGDCYEFNKKRKPKWAFDIYAGPQYSPNSFKAKSNEFIYSTSLRESTESANISFLAGARASVLVANLVFKAGFEYQHIYNQLNHVIGYDTSITVRTLNGQVVGVDTTYGKRTIKNHNYHHLISLPISIGYQKRLRENAIQVNAGLSLNLYMQSNGAILDNRLRPLQFNSPLEIYKNSLGLSPFINVQWNGPIMHNLRYFFEPQFQYNPSFDNSSYGIKHNMNSYQLKFGLQYLFH